MIIITVKLCFYYSRYEITFINCNFYQFQTWNNNLFKTLKQIGGRFYTYTYTYTTVHWPSGKPLFKISLLKLPTSHMNSNLNTLVPNSEIPLLAWFQAQNILVFNSFVRFHKLFKCFYLFVHVPAWYIYPMRNNHQNKHHSHRDIITHDVLPSMSGVPEGYLTYTGFMYFAMKCEMGLWIQYSTHKTPQ